MEKHTTFLDSLVDVGKFFDDIFDPLTEEDMVEMMKKVEKENYEKELHTAEFECMKTDLECLKVKMKQIVFIQEHINELDRSIAELNKRVEDVSGEILFADLEDVLGEKDEFTKRLTDEEKEEIASLKKVLEGIELVQKEIELDISILLREQEKLKDTLIGYI